MADIHTILFVDDEESILHSLRRLFRREGYDIPLARSGPEGLELLRQHRVSLIISDQRMPDMIGAEFLARSQEISPDSIRMMLTGYSDLEAATQAINEGGIARYITKPWDDENLKMVVQEAIKRIDLEARNRQLARELQQKMPSSRLSTPGSKRRCASAPASYSTRSRNSRARIASPTTCSASTRWRKRWS